MLRRAPVPVGSSTRLSRRDINRNPDDNGTDNLRTDRNLRYSHILGLGRLLTSRRMDGSTRSRRGRDMAAESSLNVLQVLLEVLLQLVAAAAPMLLRRFRSGGRCRRNRCRHRRRRRRRS